MTPALLPPLGLAAAVAVMLTWVSGVSAHPNPRADDPEGSDVPVVKRPAESQLVLGLGGGVSHRASSESRADYSLGPALSAYGQIPVLSWLSVKLQTGWERHHAELDAGAFELQERAGDSELTGLLLGLELVSNWVISQDVQGWIALGAGWTRFESASLDLELTNGARAQLPRKSGVMIEFPARLGISWKPSAHQVGLSLSAAYSLATGQTGDLFESGSGTRQAVVQSASADNTTNGSSVVTIAGFPTFENALQTQLTIDFYL